MSQAWNASQYVNHASFVAEHGSPVLDLLTPKSGERILDLGCGDGALTQDIAKSGAIVHGVDSSQNMIKAAKQRGLSAEVMSGDNLIFNNQFDAVFSNAALHWMTNKDSVLHGVANSLKSNGRFVGEFGGQGNVATLVNAMNRVFKHHSEFGDLSHVNFKGAKVFSNFFAELLNEGLLEEKEKGKFVEEKINSLGQQ